MRFLNHEVNAEALLGEIEFFLENSGNTSGRLSNGAVIKTDVGYVSEFFEDLLQKIPTAEKNIKK